MRVGGVPFIGQNAYYPWWARGAGRWVFQRTLIQISSSFFADSAALEEIEVPVSSQLIVWVPPFRVPVFSLLPSRIHRERQTALNELKGLKLVCYGSKSCGGPKAGSSEKWGMTTATAIEETGIRPERWFLFCPWCKAVAGPDLAVVSAGPIIERWASLRCPTLNNPGAGSGLRSVPPVVDAEKWIQEMKPNHLELAYLGQQMWPDIKAMLAAMPENARSIK